MYKEGITPSILIKNSGITCLNSRRMFVESNRSNLLEAMTYMVQ